MILLLRNISADPFLAFAIAKIKKKKISQISWNQINSDIQFANNCCPNCYSLFISTLFNSTTLVVVVPCYFYWIKMTFVGWTWSSKVYSVILNNILSRIKPVNLAPEDEYWVLYSNFKIQMFSIRKDPPANMFFCLGTRFKYSA